MKILVLAGNRKQFDNFMNQKNWFEDDEYFCADFPDRVLGRRYDDFKIIGTFWDRGDASEMYDLAKSLLTPKREE